MHSAIDPPGQPAGTGAGEGEGEGEGEGGEGEGVEPLLTVEPISPKRMLE